MTTDEEHKPNGEPFSPLRCSPPSLAREKEGKKGQGAKGKGEREQTTIADREISSYSSESPPVVKVGPHRRRHSKNPCWSSFTMMTSSIGSPLLVLLLVLLFWVSTVAYRHGAQHAAATAAAALSLPRPPPPPIWRRAHAHRSSMSIPTALPSSSSSFPETAAEINENRSGGKKKKKKDATATRRRRPRLRQGQGDEADDLNGDGTSSSASGSSAAAAAAAALSSSGSGSSYSYAEPPNNLDAMRARAGVLRTSILRQQVELQQLERQIVCCSASGGASSSAQKQQRGGPSLASILAHPAGSISLLARTFRSSTNVLLRKLNRVRERRGPQNEKWESVRHYVGHQAGTAGRIVHDLVVKNPHRLRHLVDPETPTLLPHVPAILARLDKLEVHVTPILERVLNNRRHLASIEPYLDDILERFDDIEPHLPWILANIDVLAPYTGLLLKHIDELLLYAEVDEHERSLEEGRGGTTTSTTSDAGGGDDKDSYALADQLLPFLEYYVSRLDVIGPHLPLLRPHVPLLLKHDRIAKVSPHMDRLFRRGYLDLNVSANLDVLLFWFGWSLRIPGVPALFFSLPFSPRLCSLLARRLPRRFARGYCSGVSCSLDGDYGAGWNQLSSKSSRASGSSDTNSGRGLDYSI